jgi:rubrerythrin
MPRSGTPFWVLAEKQPMTHEELIWAVRLMVAPEYEAVQLYTELAQSTYNTPAIDVLKSIANEERGHAGELLRLLKDPAPDEEKFYDDGAKEVEQQIGKHKSK